uniref:SWIM-type domain-containing protein n=1 Tax=Lactuca sativa TaxID=4236 RepID=A0A9R1UV86_LACSA|nr:hypothetical protein LSAT_V11C800437320 [Lactuca sativa]
MLLPELTGDSNKDRGNLVLSKKTTFPWVLFISRVDEKQLWTVKTYEDSHSCLQTRTVRACSSKFLANNILHQVESNPKIPTRALQEELVQRYSLSISKMKVFRAKAMAKQYVYGDYEKQYGVLREYAMELKSKNLGTTVKIDVETEPNVCSETRIFKRIYTYLGPLKEGFKKGLRDFLGFDGTFLKGPFLGQILTAVGLDSNNGIYPVAYAIIETENINSWTWFLEHLGDDLDLNSSSNFTFISDRQKGILAAIEKLFPSAKQRFCLRHVYDNMKLKHKGDELREAVWCCGKVYNIPKFNRAMEKLKKPNPKAHEWLSKIPAKHWARSHFSRRALTDSLTNNLCEVFNSKLDEARDKPIITCLEYIREYLTKRIVNVHKVLDKCNGSLSTTATTILENNKTEASKMGVLFNGADKYQVTGLWMEQYVVNLKERSCTCRKWDITGIPCQHAIAAMYDKMQNGSECGDPEAWVSKCYWLSTWNAMYQHTIDPINGRSMWPRSDCPTTLLPPKHHKQVGRPKKKRKRAVDEPTQSTKLSRKHLTVTCSKCHNKGHNARTCKGQGGPSEAG